MKRRAFAVGIVGVLAGCSNSNANDSEPTVEDTPNDKNDSDPTAENTPNSENGDVRNKLDATLQIERGNTVTHTFGNIIELRDFGWTNEELNYGTPGAVGTVENIGSDRIGQANLDVQFYDGDTQIGTNVSWLDFLSPDEYGEIEVPFSEGDPSRVTRLQVSASAQDRISQVNDGEVALSDNGLTTDENGWPTVTGTAENLTEGRLQRVYIFVNFYNGQELLGQGKDALSRLGAGESGEWSVSTDRVGEETVTRYSVIATIQG